MYAKLSFRIWEPQYMVTIFYLRARRRDTKEWKISSLCGRIEQNETNERFYVMLEKVNLKAAADADPRLYIYNKVGCLNGQVLSVVNVENRTLDFHVHEGSDELFYVIEGGFQLETDEGLIPVGAGELIIVPKGTRHRPVVRELSMFLMIELDGTLNKENSGDSYEN